MCTGGYSIRGGPATWAPRLCLGWTSLAFAMLVSIGCGVNENIGPDFPRADLEIVHSGSANQAFEGGDVTFVTVVRNLGPAVATGIVAKDSLSAGLGYVLHDASTGSFVPSTGLWTIGSLNPGAEVSLALLARVAGGTAGDTLTHRVGVLADTLVTHDANLSNNLAQGTVQVLSTAPPPDSTGLLFASNWSTALGTSVAATGDGGRWTDFYCDATSRARVMSVVPGAPFSWTLTPNVLQLTMDGTNCGLIQNQRDIPPGVDYYVRMYVMVLDANVNTTNHPYKTSWRGSNGIIMWSLQSRNPTARTYRPTLRLNHTNWIDPNFTNNYGVEFYGPTLNYGEWYRFETKIEYVGDPALGRSRAIPRIFNSAGQQIADESNYVYTADVFPSYPQTTLQESLADGAYYQHRTVDGYLVGHIHWPAMGYEGPFGNQPSGERYFFAGFEARRDRYPGPITP